jgi:hypothetical protein
VERRSPENARPATKLCVVCGRPVPFMPSEKGRYRRPQRLTCSRECLRAIRRRHIRDVARDQDMTLWDRDGIIHVLQQEAKRRRLRFPEWRGRRATRHATTGEFLDNGIPHRNTIVRHFGSWNAALEAAGLPTRRWGAERWWTREEAIVLLQRDAKRRGRPPTRREWDKARFTQPSANTVGNLFGSWNAALEAAGLPTREAGYAGRLSRRRWTREEIILLLQQDADRLGRPPLYLEWDKPSKKRPSGSTVQSRFGSWNAALEAAGLRTRNRRHYNAKLTVEAVRAIRVSTESLSLVARRYGVSRSTVSLIRRGKTWKDVTIVPRPFTPPGREDHSAAEERGTVGDRLCDRDRQDY